MSGPTKWLISVACGVFGGMLFSLYIGEWVRPHGTPTDPTACYVVEAPARSSGEAVGE